MAEELDIRSPSVAEAVKFRSGAMAHKTAILERHVDVARLLGAYTWDTLPTRYLTAYTPTDKLKNMDDVARGRAEKVWPSNRGDAASREGAA
jgi:hypothetical protein